MIRPMRKEDIPTILSIYAPYVQKTLITFEYTVPTLAEFTKRCEAIAAQYPYIVWEEDGEVVAYAYADKVFSRAAYAWDAEASIYLREDKRGKGIGNRLYACLEELLKLYGYRNLYGIITETNQVSIAFHEKNGYAFLGKLPMSGYKHGEWVGVCWYGKTLIDYGAPSKAPQAFFCGEKEAEICARYCF